jgi:hypothetical protein
MASERKESVGECDLNELFKKIDDCFDKYTDFFKIGCLPQAYIDSRYNELKKKFPTMPYKTSDQIEALAIQEKEDIDFSEKVRITKEALLYPEYIMDKIEKCEEISTEISSVEAPMK